MKVLFVAPTQGYGGISSWAANYRKNCPREYKLVSVGVSKRRSLNVTAGMLSRVCNGILDIFDTIREIKSALSDNPDIKLMHLTTSGKLGTIRDFYIVKAAKRRGVKCIVHCHFGSVWSQINENGLLGKCLKATFEMADMIWVLDHKSFNALKEFPSLKEKVIITPNFLDVPSIKDIKPKTYKDVAFVGNLFPTKGIFELVKAVASLDNKTTLHIIGPGLPNVIEHIKELAGLKIDIEIKLYGRLPNDKAVDIIGKMDIIALPTYYPGEAFPISILEAMSRGKMVLSCDRGAIKDMLTCSDGSICGLIVEPRNSADIMKAIIWSQNHKNEADEMCKKAYEKVYNAYRTDVIMKLYTDCYKKLLENND